VNIHPEIAASRIRSGMEKAFRSDPAGCLLSLPGDFRVEITYKEHINAYLLGFYPGAKQVDPNTVQFETQNYFEVLRFFLFAP
jgi:D-amino peptidase